MPKLEVRFLWGLYCFHALMKPESVSDRYLKPSLKLEATFLVLSSRDNVSSGWYVFISCTLQAIKVLFL